MLFPTIKVPKLPHITLYRDHKDDYTFYPMLDKPRLAHDPDGNLMLSFNMFSRNADIAYASSENKELIESQLGQLLMTCDLSVTQEEHEIIVDYLAKMISDEKKLFNRVYYKFLKRKRKPTRANDLKHVIKLAYPDTWNDGTARLEILEGLGDTFKKSSSAEVKPALLGSNPSSFYATFGIEGAQVMFDALTKGYKESGSDDEATPLQSIVRYDLKGFAWVPNMEIKVRANNTQVHKFLQEREEDYRKEKRGGRSVKRVRVWPFYSKTTVRDNRSLTVRKEDMNSIVEEMIDRKVVHMEITDYSGVGASDGEMQEIENQIKQSVIELITGQMLPAFFQTAFIGDTDEVSENGEEEEEKSDDDLGINPGEDNVPTVDTYYSFVNDIEKTKHVSIGFTFKKNGTVPFQRFPNGTLVADVSPEERKKLIKQIDVSSPEVQILQVQSSVNADFDAGNIDSVIVNLKYSQRDHKTGVVRENSKSYRFTSRDDVHWFRVTMARDAQNRLLDFYDVTAKIHYKNTSESPPEIKLEGVSDRALVISYDKLGFVTVNCMAGEIDWSVVKDVIVDFQYLAEPNESDTKKQIRLNEESLSGDWKCYMYGNEDKTYEYKIKYIYHDGTESTSEPKRDTRDTLIIDDELVGRMKASFDMILDPETVKSAKIEILYQDDASGVKEEYSKWFENSETWDWSMRLREDASDEFKYRYTVQYQDGLVKSSDWKTAKSDEDVPPISLRRHKKNIMIDAGMLDWTKWKVVYVNISFSDTQNNYHESKTFRMTEDSMMETFSALAFHSTTPTFTYTMKLASQDGNIIDVPENTVEGGVLIIEEPA